ncbi:MAG: glycosyltransferase [Phototrophicales bacterium]
MKIVFIAFPNSIHTVRWIQQLQTTGWDIYIFPSLPQQPNAMLEKCVVFHPSINYWGMYTGENLSLIQRLNNKVKYEFTKLFRPLIKKNNLCSVLEYIKPDVVHYMEFQHAGYLLLDTLKKCHYIDFKIIGSNWGSDIYLFGRLQEHKSKIRNLLTITDFYTAECERDVALAKSFGYKNHILPVMPISGGFDVEKYQQLAKTPPSKRKVVLVKGYQHFAGRALTALDAIRLCAESLSDYKIVIYSCGPDVKIAANLLIEDKGLDIVIQEYMSHEQLIELFGQARVHIGISISDGISHSLMESMIMGVFPVQTWTACADEWIVDGETGILVSPYNPFEIAEAIQRSINDDALVDDASVVNKEIALKRLDRERIASQVIDMYKTINEVY